MAFPLQIETRGVLGTMRSSVSIEYALEGVDSRVTATAGSETEVRPIAATVPRELLIEVERTSRERWIQFDVRFADELQDPPRSVTVVPNELIDGLSASPVSHHRISVRGRVPETIECGEHTTRVELEWEARGAKVRHEFPVTLTVHDPAWIEVRQTFIHPRIESTHEQSIKLRTSSGIHLRGVVVEASPDWVAVQPRHGPDGAWSLALEARLPPGPSAKETGFVTVLFETTNGAKIRDKLRVIRLEGR